MKVIDDTVAEFGASLGLNDLQLRENGSVVLTLQSIGTLALDVAGPTQDAMIVSLSRPLPRADARDLRTLLGVSHYRMRSPLPVQVGVRGDQLILAVVLPLADFTLLKINQVIRELDRQHQALEASR